MKIDSNKKAHFFLGHPNVYDYTFCINVILNISNTQKYTPRACGAHSWLVLRADCTTAFFCRRTVESAVHILPILFHLAIPSQCRCLTPLHPHCLCALSLRITLCMRLLLRVTHQLLQASLSSSYPTLFRRNWSVTIKA